MDSCNIKVAIKARPLNHKEQLDGKVYWKIESDGSVVHVDPATQKKNGDQFFFDRVFCGKSTNYDVFDNIVRPIIDRGVQGFNGTVLAYGQTASGKTHTMSGDESNPGIIPLAINYMFNIMNSSTSREYLLRASYVEIYNEKVIDLLEKKDNKSQMKKIEIQKDGLHITPLKAIVCQNAQMVMDFMKMGEQNRSIGETNMNERSSRSHTIFRIILESRKIDDDSDGAYQQSVINLVDLAGSERSSLTQSSMERFKEGCKINSSLTTLGLVIQQLSECPDSSQHINFRDSKLTRILQTSLGGNSLTAIICTITLAVDDQTLNTLSFASRAKKIKNSAKVNENVTDETLLKRYRIQLSKLNSELEGMKSDNNEVNEIKYKYQEEKRSNEELKARIMRLQKNMITSSVGHTDQLSNKKGYNRRRTWGGKLDHSLASNYTLETIEEDINSPRISVPSNFGHQLKDFKTPLEPFEWDLIKEEKRSEDTKSINKENIDHDLSPPSSLPTIVCETPKKILRERVKNYKNMFESSMKENNELREFTTLERQMFYENNEQLKDLDNLKKQVEKLLTDKNESTLMIEKLKNTIQSIENEKRDVEVVMEMQKRKYETRETELLATIQETKVELKCKEKQLNEVLSNNTFIAEMQDEIQKLETKILEMNKLNELNSSQKDNLNSMLLNKDKELNEESAKHCLLLSEIRSIPYSIQFLANNGFYTLEKTKIDELDQLLEIIHCTVDQFQQENQILKDENNNLKSITTNLTDLINNIKKENSDMKSHINFINKSIKTVTNDLSASSEIDVDNSNLDSLIEFAVNHFEQSTNEIAKLANENHILKEELSVSQNKLSNNEWKSQLGLIDANIRSFIKDFSASSEIDVDNSNLDSLIEFVVNHFEQNTNEIAKLANENHILKEELSVSQNKLSNNEWKSQLGLIDANIRSFIKDFSASSEIDVDNSNLDSLIEFAVTHFEHNTNNINELSNENLNLKKELFVSNNKLDEVKSFMFDTLDNIIEGISTMEFESSTEIEKLKKELAETVKENFLLKSSIQVLNKLTFDCVEIVERVKINFSSTTRLHKDLTECNNKIKSQIEIDELYKINADLKLLLKSQNEVVEEFQEELHFKSLELENVLSKLNEVQSAVDDNKIKTANSNLDYLQALKVLLENQFSCVAQLEKQQSYFLSYFTKLNTHCKPNIQSIEQKTQLEKQLQDEFNDNQLQIEIYYVVIERLSTSLKSIKADLEEKLNTLIEMEINKIENTDNTKTNELINASNQMSNEKIDEKTDSYVSIVEKLKNEFVVTNTKPNNELLVINELENRQSEVAYYSNLKEKSTDELNRIIINLKSDLEEKVNQECVLRNSIQIISDELEDAIFKVNEVKLIVNNLNIQCESSSCVVEQLDNNLKCVQSTLEEKLNLITELESMNSELLSKCSSSDQISNQLKHVVCELETKLEKNTVIENELQNELQAKSLELENAFAKENEIQSLIESMENEIKSNTDSIKQVKSELEIKSNLLIDIEKVNSELLVKCEMSEIKINDYETNLNNLKDQLQTIDKEKKLIQEELNSVNQKIFEMAEHHDQTKNLLEDKLKLQVLNYQHLYEDFVSLSCDIESQLQLQIDTEFTLREEIVSKSTEINDLHKQIHESSLEQHYSKLEDEYMLKSREVDEVREKLVSLESHLSSKEETEIILRNKLKSKCADLDEYKKNVEFLFSRNDSFQVRVNDFEENVLVDLNEEFDLMKSELAKKSENENILLREKAELESSLKELENKCINVSIELDLSQERSEDLASIINVLVIEIKDANSVKDNLMMRLNEAEHEILKSDDLAKSFENELYILQREFENACIKAESVNKDLCNMETTLNTRDVNNQLIDPLVDYVHDIKLKLTELNSAIISGNKSEKQFRTKVMSVEGETLLLDESWKVNSDDQSLESPDIDVCLEIDNLRKVLNDKTHLINTLQEAEHFMKNNIDELQDQIKKLSDENIDLVKNVKSMEKNIKDNKSLVATLNEELSQVNKKYKELQDCNQAAKEQIHYSFDIDLELRDGKKNIVQEINLLEPGKITGVLTHHNLSNLLDTFVSLIMTKEQQIVSNLINEQTKIKQQYEDQLKQLQEDIKKEREWQEQVENDNEKLGLELENLKSQIHNFPSKEIEIKELTEKLLLTETNSFNNLKELQALKTQISKTSEQNYQALSNEFEVFKSSSEQSMQDLKTKIEDLTDKYNESLSMYKDQKSSRSNLENQIEKVRSECDCLQAIIEKKDEDIKNLIYKVELKTNEYDALIEKNSLQREEMINIHEKRVDQLQLELNEKTQQIYCTEKLLKELTKNYNQVVEDNSTNLLKLKQLQENDNSNVHTRVSELQLEIQRIVAMNNTKLEQLESLLKDKSLKLEENEIQCSNLSSELEMYKFKIDELEKQLESYCLTIKLKDDEIMSHQTKPKINDNFIDVNDVTEKLNRILKCNSTLPTLYENISILVNKHQNIEQEIVGLKDEILDLKLTNSNLDSENESMLSELRSKDDNMVELLTQLSELTQNVELLTEENKFLKDKCVQFKNVNDDVKKLNDEICGYEQNIYQLRKERGQLILQHSKELNKVKSELNEVHSKNLELYSDNNKLTETAKNLEKSLKEDIQQLHRCIVDKNAKISTLEMISKTNMDELKKKNHELEHIFKKSRDENHMLRKEIRRFREMANVRKVDQCTQTVEEQSIVSSAIMAGNKSLTEKLTKLENDNHVMKKLLHHRKAKIEELQKQLSERP